MFPRFTGKQEIVEALMRNDSVQDMVLRLGTTPAYIYNIRSRAKKLGVTFNAPNDPNVQNITQPREPQLQFNPNPAPDPAVVAVDDRVTSPVRALTQQPATPNLVLSSPYQQASPEQAEYSQQFIWTLWNNLCKMSPQDPVAHEILRTWLVAALWHNYRHLLQ